MWRERLAEIHTIKPGEVLTANTPSWYNARRGRITASVRAQTVAEWRPADLRAMRSEILSELHPEWIREHKTNEAMRWGTAHEAQAIAAVSLRIGAFVEEPGLMFDPDLPYMAATPDGLYEGEIGLVSLQVKCPFNPRRHLDNVYGQGSIKRQYWYQVQFEAMISGAKAILFASYDPRQPEATQLKLIDIPVDVDMQRQFRQNAIRFEEIMEGAPAPADGRVVGYNGIPRLI